MAVNYVSTRGENTGATYSSIVLKGLAADGGLFLPEAYPQVSARQLESWRSGSWSPGVPCPTPTWRSRCSGFLPMTSRRRI